MKVHAITHGEIGIGYDPIPTEAGIDQILRLVPRLPPRIHTVIKGVGRRFDRAVQMLMHAHQMTLVRDVFLTHILGTAEVLQGDPGERRIIMQDGSIVKEEYFIPLAISLDDDTPKIWLDQCGEGLVLFTEPDFLDNLAGFQFKDEIRLGEIYEIDTETATVKLYYPTADVSEDLPPAA